MSNYITEVCRQIFDTFTDGIKTIDNDHNYIHEGKKFMYGENFSLASAGTKLYTFTTPSVSSGKQIHLRPPKISCSGDKLKWEFIENNFVNGSGSNLLTKIYNFKRDGTSSLMQFFNGGEAEATPGTVLFPDYIGGGTNVGGNSTGGVTQDKEEIVLKVNTNYSYLFTNSSANTNVINIFLSWYEESVL